MNKRLYTRDGTEEIIEIHSDEKGCSVTTTNIIAKDTCEICGYTGEEFDYCPECGAHYTEKAQK